MEQAASSGWDGRPIKGPKLPLKPKEIWAVRIRLQMAGRVRDLALFDLGLDSKLRGCDLVKLRPGNVAIGRCSDRAQHSLPLFGRAAEDRSSSPV